MLARDLLAMLAIADARKAENAAARASMLADLELRAALRAEAERRGEAVDWNGYFSRAGVL
jgi:hypothetical protein